MKPRLRAFVDSDVVVSSLMSDQGAAYLLLSASKLDLCVSTVSVAELNRVVKRESLSSRTLEERLRKLEIVSLDYSTVTFAAQYSRFTGDPNDAHIVAGAVTANARFLITYNLKDYKILLVKNELGIIVLTPGQYLQYLRSLG